ncbi:hypothetical protein SOVF_210750 [Spinacia oleracea]|nr:hypothetical protein SOVF_210750 [Spinacia oleracea]
MSCSGGRVMVGHCYPYCPEPNKTGGIASHTDPGVLTVLLQNQFGGLQVKHEGKWVNVKQSKVHLLSMLATCFRSQLLCSSTVA